MAITKIAASGFSDAVNFRNIIINGDMSIAQRATSKTGITSTGYYTADRIKLTNSSAGTWTQSQSTDVPTGQGFATSLKMDCTTADGSLSGSDELLIEQKIEGQNLQYLKKGTSSAESLTLSFWVKSNKTGTYIAELMDNDNSNRHIGNSYTISSANTWEKKTITFAGDTTGALDNDNGDSFVASFWLAAGSNYTSGTLQTSWGSLAQTNRAVGQVNLADSTDNEWYITGVQLEAGTTASDFEFLPVDVNLERCLRYYELLASGNGKVICAAVSFTTDRAQGVLNFSPEKRSAPSLDYVTATNYYDYFRAGATPDFDSFTLVDASTKSAYLYTEALGTTTTAGFGGWFQTENANSYIAMDAEL